MIIVSDTSSISNLLQIGLIDVLQILYGEITITPAVSKELDRVSTHSNSLAQIDWIKVKLPRNRELVAKLLEELDLGEAESIALAVEEKAEYLIIDEYAGRKIADAMGVKIVGILGVLIQAKSKGIIPSVKYPIEKLVEIGFRLNEQLIESVLKSLKEI
jgi:hypothetical protein